MVRFASELWIQACVQSVTGVSSDDRKAPMRNDPSWMEEKRNLMCEGHCSQRQSQAEITVVDSGHWNSKRQATGNCCLDPSRKRVGESPVLASKQSISPVREVRRHSF